MILRREKAIEIHSRALIEERTPRSRHRYSASFSIAVSFLRPFERNSRGAGRWAKGREEALFLLAAIYFGQHSFPQMCYRQSRGKKMLLHVRARVYRSREKSPLARLLELLSADFIYIEKIIDKARKNAITSEKDAMAGGRERTKPGRDLSSRNCSARFNPRNSRCVADIGGTCYVRDNRYKG